MTIKLAAVASLASIALLAGCAAPESPEPEPTTAASTPAEETPSPSMPDWVIPDTCAIDSIVSTIDSSGFPGAVDVTPAWSPAAGTDLAAALDADGIACGYGIPETDSGITLYWVPDAIDVFADTAAAVWVPEGSSIVDLDLSVDEVAAHFQYIPADEDNFYPHWEVNVLFEGGLWLHVATSSWQQPNDGNSIIETMLTVAEG